AFAYKVRTGTSGAWTTLGDVATHTFTGLSANTAYTLQVAANNRGGDSALAQTSATTLTEPQEVDPGEGSPAAPAAPTSLQTSGITHNSITLTWTKSDGATSYEIQGGTENSWTDVGDVATYTFSGLTANTAYVLQVRAKNSSGDSPTAQTSATTLPTPPAAPTGLQSSGITHNSITLNWTKSTGATSYEVNGGKLSGWTDVGDVATYTFSGLKHQRQYTLQVRAKKSGSLSAAASLDATTNHSANAPATPTGLNTSDITHNSITLNWSDADGASAYKVRTGTSGAWTTLGDVTTYTFSGLTANTQYTLQVAATSLLGESTPAQTTATTFALAAPTSLQTSGITQSAITLTWTKSAGATAYKVRTGTSGAWTTLGDVATYTFSSLTANTKYTLQVAASSSNGESAAASISATTLVTPSAAPAAPTGLQTSAITHNSITLSWTKSAGATAYKVRTGTTGALTTLGDVATYTFSSLSADTAYTLQVLASNSNGDSSPAQTSASTFALAAPTSLQTSAITHNSITLTWTKSAGATSYEVNGGALSGWTDVGDVATYTFSGLTANTQYTLQARAKKTGGESAPASASATTLTTPPAAPAAPTGLQTSAITHNSITLAWTKSNGATGYKVQANSGAVTTLGDVATYTFSGLTANTAYTLKVIASNRGGDSAAASASATTLTTPPAAPAAPTGLQTSGVTKTAITLSWTKSTGATAYKVQANSGAVTTLGDVATYTFSGLTANTAYTLKVIASNRGGDSAAASVSASTLPNAPAAPTGLQTSGIKKTAITLSWTKSTGATGYKVQANNGAVATLGDVATHTFSSLSAGTRYTLKVIATNAGGDSAAASVSASTLLAAPTGLQTSGI
ncbi:MAG: fibronectin type III domain-containing protein, partial [Chloroflexi bacterium]|nr:fibronectin type III domain-containing protein [Chloroflexota bacterium]